MSVRTSLITPSTPDAVPAVPTVTWTSPDGGTVLTLSDFGGNDWGISVLPGATGFGMPDFTYYETSSPSFDGSVVRGVRANPRDVNLPILLWGANRAQCVENYHGLIRAMNPRNGAGTLTVTSADGTSRSLAAYYNGGLQGKDDDAENGMTFMTAVVVLRCPAPFWLGDPSVTRLQIAYGSTFFPLLPVQLVASSILGSTTLVNDGDAEAFPIYTITGPVTNPAIANATNGTFITINQTLLAGETITIDTREGVKTVLKGDGTNLYSSMASGSSLAPLQSGSNAMTFTVLGATTNTSVVISYQNRYLTAY